MNDEVEWRDIPGFPGYQVSNHAEGVRVRSPRRELAQWGNSGYLYTTHSVEGKKQNSGVHRLYALAFLDCKPGDSVNHKNGDKADNRPENLEVCSHGDNIRHARDMLGNSGRQKLSREAASVIKALRVHAPEAFKCGDLSEIFGIAAVSVRGIERGYSWSDLPHDGCEDIEIAAVPMPPRAAE